MSLYLRDLKTKILFYFFNSRAYLAGESIYSVALVMSRLFESRHYLNVKTVESRLENMSRFILELLQTDHYCEAAAHSKC